MTLTGAGFICGLSGALVIILYTLFNFHLRRRGENAAWLGGWVLGATGMTLMAAGWVMLTVAGPRHDSLPLCCLGLFVLLVAVGIYLASARRVGRLRPRARYYG